MKKIQANLVDDPSKAYQEVEIEGYNDSMKLERLDSKNLKIFRKPTNYLITSSKILGISNVILNHQNFGAINNIVFNPSIADKIFHYTEKNFEFIDKKIFFNVQNEESIRKGIFLGSHWNYGHWLFNHFARLYYCQSILKDTTIIVNNSINNDKFKILKYFGISEKNIKIIDKGTVLNVEELIIPQMPWHSINNQVWWAPNSFNFLRENILSNNIYNNDAKLNIFITRSTARWRKVINEDKLFSIAKNYNFELVDIGTLSVDEQINLGLKTKNLISPIGANSNFFINLPKNSKFIELAPPIKQMNVSGIFASASQIDFLQIKGRPEKKVGVSDLDVDYNIDENEFLEKLKSFFKISS